MWREDKVPLVEFHRICRGHLDKSDYKLLLTLISRKADAPRIFEEIRENWSSFHDVTGHQILFMFAGDNIGEIENNSHILYQSISKSNSHTSQYQEAIVYSDSAIVAGNYTNRIGKISRLSNVERGAPRIANSEDFEDMHSLEISKLARELKISERQIPCINLYYLPLGISDNIEVFNDRSIYSLIKEISACYYESKISSWDKGKISEINRNRQRQLVESHQRKIEKIEAGVAFREQFEFWISRWRHKPPYNDNERIQEAIKVIQSFPNTTEKDLKESIRIFKQDLPQSNRYQKIINYLAAYFNKFTPEKILELKNSSQKAGSGNVDSPLNNSFFKFAGKFKN